MTGFYKWLHTLHYSRTIMLMITIHPQFAVVAQMMHVELILYNHLYFAMHTVYLHYYTPL